MKKITKRASRSITCPSCKELQEKYAGSVVELHGKAWQEKEDEVLRTIRRTEEIARSRNDQERILWLEKDRGKTSVFVTLRQLARKIGHRLQQSFKGQTEFHRSTEEPFLRVVWSMGPEELSEKRNLGRSKRRRNRGLKKR